ILSMTITRTFGDWFWGVGSLASITPQGIVIAVSPLILLSFLENARRPRLVLTFMAIGLCGNLHLISAVNLGLVLLIVHLGRNRFRWQAILKGTGCVVFFLLGVLPYLLYFLVMKHNITADMPAGASESAEAVLDALRLSDLAVLYPEMLKSLLQWALYLSVLVLLSGIMLWKSDRFTSRDVGVWVWMMAAGCVVALGFHGISQGLGMLLGEAPPFIDFPQAACWVMLAAYVLFAQALTLLFRMIRSDKNKRYLRWACAMFLLIWMLPSDNLRVFRHMTYRLAILDDRAQELADDAAEQAELVAIADWAKQNSDIDAVFLTDQEQFRCLAKRAIFVNRDDIRHFYYLTPWMLGQWTDQLRKQSQWLGDPINADEIISGVGGLRSQESYRGVPQWYVLLSAQARLENPGRLEEQTSPAWRHHWRIFKIPPP
ncbi:MAG: hypothetical protein K8S55_08935, partial [Phycisphaerae bacterium]|nr:hypothetical protein [Phycisphaerae bacterium]